MVLTGQTDKYEELRNAYNSVVDEDNEVCCVMFPPMEEWPGMTRICDYAFCRWVGCLFRLSCGALSDVCVACFCCGARLPLAFFSVFRAGGRSKSYRIVLH